MTVTERIDNLLKSRKMSRRQLAIAAGIPPSSLQSAMSRGRNMTIEMLLAISGVLDISAAYLLCGARNEGCQDAPKDDSSINDYGTRIRAARENAGMTQSELAKKLNIPYQGIGQWERGVRTPKIETLKRISSALGVSFSQLAEGSDMKKFYFTYGTEGQPFYGGWTEVEAPDGHSACAAFRAYHPDKTEGLLNCSSVYDEDHFKTTEMYQVGNFGYRCHEVIRITRTEVPQ